ncbi:MAG: porin family protein [Bacteroidota bacterium]
MKKLILLTLSTITILHSRAQDSSTRITPIQSKDINMFNDKEYRFSISVMPLVSWMSPDSRNISSKGSRVGFSGGITVEKNLSENVAFCGGLHITQMGGKIGYDSLRVKNGTTTFNDIEYTYKTRYIDIPLTIKLRTDEFGYSRVYFDAGLALNFLWRGRADINKDIFTNAQGGSEDRDVNDKDGDFDINNSVVEDDDIGFLRVPLLVGAGYEYALSKNTVVFGGLRYNAGLFNMMSAPNTKAYNNYFGINVGLLF